MITACFAHALQRCTSRVFARFLLILHEVKKIDKTCNQLYASTCVSTGAGRGANNREEVDRSVHVHTLAVLWHGVHLPLRHNTRNRPSLADGFGL